MKYWLLKTEPSVYSYADMQKDKETLWDGVANPQAVKFLSTFQPGDAAIFYHTGDERTAVGTVKVISVDASNPRDPKIHVKVGKAVAEPKNLAAIKTSALFADSPLVRQGRLSVVPLTEDQFAWLTGS